VVTAVGRDGSLRVRAGTSSPETVLPAPVALHVELGYAVTAHQRQVGRRGAERPAHQQLTGPHSIRPAGIGDRPHMQQRLTRWIAR
jgi:hypothetical protein